MVQLTRIYTRGGDKGKTSLGNGTRVAKTDRRVEAYGTVDEANSVIGIARLHSQNGQTPDVDAMLSRIQNDLFDLGGDLCVPEEGAPEWALRVTAAQVERLEAEIDAMNAGLDPLKSFILPGGSALSAHLHHARTVVRRAERLISDLADHETINPQTLIYANRLSDHLFVLARVTNGNGAGDVLWVPGANRS
ncbi:cob(I)yrinic acid a,c-diamide adenosyltransferase [Novispirillum itersonii]|uniref:Corrinoid adenosyltransferase n=1 Tax=Novispirillum itersonii TaxID=189 RepID=A0A7X0DL53_NOVIT|nr:cob(I)yrinic acid a,c-diamide adenosyltransferase [Novispirillum itersonii]MBB6209625.1 cob(I)alamin adenosyltransferase [Novispirillum itersonii]